MKTQCRFDKHFIGTSVGSESFYTSLVFHFFTCSNAFLWGGGGVLHSEPDWETDPVKNNPVLSRY